MFLIGQRFVRRTAILDHLDEWIGEAKAMIAACGPDRRRQLRICAPATGWAKRTRAHHSRNDSDRRWVRRNASLPPTNLALRHSGARVSANPESIRPQAQW